MMLSDEDVPTVNATFTRAQQEYIDAIEQDAIDNENEYEQ